MSNQSVNNNGELRVCGICQKPIGPMDKTQVQQLDEGMGLAIMYHQECVDAVRQILRQEQLLDEVAQPEPSGNVKHVEVGQVQAQKATPRPNKGEEGVRLCSLCNKPTTSKYGVHDACMEQAYPYGRPRP